MTTLKAIARRVRALEDEAAEHEKAIRAIVTSWRPDLLTLTGVGPVAFAMRTGTGPIPASSGKTVRHRLDPATRAYAERRQAPGKTDREIRRCLGRYVTRQIYRQLETQPLAALDAS